MFEPRKTHRVKVSWCCCTWYCVITWFWFKQWYSAVFRSSYEVSGVFTSFAYTNMSFSIFRWLVNSRIFECVFDQLHRRVSSIKDFILQHLFTNIDIEMEILCIKSRLKSAQILTKLMNVSVLGKSQAVNTSTLRNARFDKDVKTIRARRLHYQRNLKKSDTNAAIQKSQMKFSTSAKWFFCCFSKSFPRFSAASCTQGAMLAFRKNGTSEWLYK